MRSEGLGAYSPISFPTRTPLHLVIITLDSHICYWRVQNVKTVKFPWRIKFNPLLAGTADSLIVFVTLTA